MSFQEQRELLRRLHDALEVDGFSIQKAGSGRGAVVESYEREKSPDGDRAVAFVTDLGLGELPLGSSTVRVLHIDRDGHSVVSEASVDQYIRQVSSEKPLTMAVRPMLRRVVGVANNHAWNRHV